MKFSPPVKATHLETPTQEDKIELGIDNSEVSTLTWIGYDEYQEQLARFAEVEQASMKKDAQTSKPIPTLEFLNEAARPMVEMAMEFLESMRGIKITTPSRDLPTKEKVKQKPTKESVHQKPTKNTDPVSVEEPYEGNPSDRDSEATSIIHVSRNMWKSGKPLAADGIVLRPRRPSFTANQLASYAPRDIVACLTIDKSGKPIMVSITSSTGSRSIDRSLLSSLYRWRASGDKIKSLRAGENVKITIHIMFSN